MILIAIPKLIRLIRREKRDIKNVKKGSVEGFALVNTTFLCCF